MTQTTIKAIANSVYSKPDGSAIDCEITLNDDSVHPYTASANDSTDYGQKLWKDLISRKLGAIAPYPAASQQAAIKAQALANLEQNDSVAVRCLKAGVPYPQTWLDYDKALRVLVQSGAGSMPARPEYPEGT